jgi:hypothetical protein
VMSIGMGDMGGSLPYTAAPSLPYHA